MEIDGMDLLKMRKERGNPPLFLVPLKTIYRVNLPFSSSKLVNKLVSRLSNFERGFCFEEISVIYSANKPVALCFEIDYAVQQQDIAGVLQTIVSDINEEV
jgi:hypothetical protein